MKSFVESFTGFFAASKFIRKNRLYYFYLVPFIFSLIVYYFLFKYVREGADSMVEWLMGKWGIDQFLTSHSEDWWGKVLNFLTGIFKFSIGIGTFFISMVIMKYILLAFLSPWFAYISEKTEKKINNQDYPFSWIQLLKDAWRGVLISIRNFAYEISINLLCFVLGIFVPILSPLLFLINLYVGAYFYGFSMMDYVCERKKLGVRDSILYIKKRKGVALGLGLAMWLLNYIPIFGLTYASVNGAVSASKIISQKE